jgi:hypothetical protein
MPLKYASTPQLRYNDCGSRVDRLIAKIPAGARPMNEAPANTSIVVQGQDGVPHWAMQHRNQYEILRPEKDRFTGAVRWSMCGQAVENPVAWWIPQQKR